MAENLKKKPKRGILKSSTSFDKAERKCSVDCSAKETKWDEMNIIATFHPPDKDYGHMKIEEPKTPYNYNDDSAEEIHGPVSPEDLTQRLVQSGSSPPRDYSIGNTSSNVEETESDDEIEGETPEERAKRKAFEMKRKAHYNEFAAVKLARKLMEEEEDEEGEGSAGLSSDSNLRDLNSSANASPPVDRMDVNSVPNVLDTEG